MHFPYSIVFEFGCLLFFLALAWRRIIGWWQLFAWLLLLTLATEITGYCMYYLHHLKNHWLYNLFLPFEFLLTCRILYRICQPNFNSRTLLLLGSFIFTVLYLVESFHAHFSSFSSYANDFSSIWILVICFLYFYHLLKQKEYISLLQHPPFWIVTGLFFFNFGSIACNLFFDYLMVKIPKEYIPINYIIFTVLNFILYGCWSYAFICRYRQMISS